MKVVFDTNVVVAALLPNGLCHEAFRRAARRRVLVSSIALLDELKSTLRRKFIITATVRTFLQTFHEQIQLVEPTPLPSPVCRDPDDDLVLATALAAAADRIVTGDHDLLVLRVHKGVRLVTPRQFLEWLDEERNDAN